MTGEEFAIIADGIGATSSEIAAASGFTYRHVHRMSGMETVPEAAATALERMEEELVAAAMSQDYSKLSPRSARIARWVRRFYSST